MISPSLPDRARSPDPPQCLRCGKCCHYRDKEGKVKACRYLICIGSKTHCRIYRGRLGVQIYPGLWCCPRSLCLVDFEGCPYNSGKPLFEVDTPAKQSTQKK